MKKYKTFIKYTVFYIIFMIVSFFGLFFIIKNNLSKSVEGSLNKQMENNMSGLCESLSDDFIDLSQISSQIRTDFSLSLFEYKSNYIDRVMNDSLTRYVTNNSLLVDIICCRLQTGQIFSTNYWITYKDAVFTINDYNKDSFTISCNTIFENKNKLWTGISEKGNSYLCYFPDNNTRQDIVFYILDSKELKKQLEGVFLPNITKIQITGHQGVVYEQSNGDIKRQHYKQYEFTCSYPEIMLTVWVNPDITRMMVAESLWIPYFILILISSIGIFCFFFFVRNTYIPLRNFAESVYQDSLEQCRTKDITNLGEIYNKFNHMQDENKKLLLKVHNYRIEIQKSILGTITENQKEFFSVSDIDTLFSEEHHNYFIIYLIFHKELSADLIRNSIIMELGPTMGKVFLLEKDDETGTLLISGDAAVLKDKESLNKIIVQVRSKVQFEFYSSSASSSIMNFPRLYEEAMQSSLQPLAREKIKKPLYTEVTQYPYQLIDQIQNDLKNDMYDRGIEHLKEVFDKLEERKYPDFFIRSIYLDVITVIFNQFCLHDIVFTKYSNSYYKALFMCRSKDYSQKEETNTAILNFLQTYIKLVGAPKLTITHILKFIRNHYTEVDFSIAIVSEEFQVSVSYFSSWFSKETGEKFVDYVWELRFQKVVELMKDSSIATKEIALQIGYLNYSSFSRKFKEHTGKSPREYRELN